MRLIDADALVDEIDRLNTWVVNDYGYCLEDRIVIERKQVEHLIETTPTVERPRGEWISVEDRLPRRRAEYLCIYQFGDKAEYRYCGVLMFHPEENAENCYIKGSHFSDEGMNNMRVVYWMPLPEAPDMRGEEE